MKRLLLVLGLLAVGCLLESCNASVTIVVPYCPLSDSARAKADSIPLGCTRPDSVKR